MRYILAAVMVPLVAITILNTYAITSISRGLERQRSQDNDQQAKRNRSILHGAYDIRIIAHQTIDDPSSPGETSTIINVINVGNTSVLSQTYSIAAVSEAGLVMEIDAGGREIQIGNSIEVKIKSIIISSTLGVGKGGTIKFIAIGENGGYDYNANDNHIEVIYGNVGQYINRTAQQVDSAEASTIAVRPSNPSGSPR